MFSDHAPNRNPAEASFAAVDRRMTSIQREEFLNIVKFYDVASYWIRPDGLVSIMHADGGCMGYLDKSGKFTPEY